MQILQEKNSRAELTLLKDDTINKLKFTPGCKTEVESGTANYFSSCLQCLEPRCMYLDSSEIECDRVENFSFSQENEVCPFEAISWDQSIEAPIINADKCIECGLCASRCPMGAIYYDGSKFDVNRDYSEDFEKVPINEVNVQKHYDQINRLLSVDKLGKLRDEDDNVLNHIYEQLEDKSHTPNKLVRNVMISLGANSSMRRVGDNYTRMDVIYQLSNGSFGAVEVEFGKDSLEASRAILDDIAVLQSRYGIDKNENKAIVVLLSLPTIRQGYWQVVKDIHNVENIEINTMTLGGMLLLLWNFYKLDLGNDNYYADYDNPTIRSFIERDLDRSINISEGFLGILEPTK